MIASLKQALFGSYSKDFFARSFIGVYIRSIKGLFSVIISAVPVISPENLNSLFTVEYNPFGKSTSFE